MSVRLMGQLEIQFPLAHLLPPIFNIQLLSFAEVAIFLPLMGAVSVAFFHRRYDASHLHKQARVKCCINGSSSF